MFYSQKRIDHGELVRWTKGINVANTEGQDVAAMFAKSLEKLVRKRSSLPSCIHILNSNFDSRNFQSK